MSKKVKKYICMAGAYKCDKLRPELPTYTVWRLWNRFWCLESHRFSHHLQCFAGVGQSGKTAGSHYCIPEIRTAELLWDGELKECLSDAWMCSQIRVWFSFAKARHFPSNVCCTKRFKGLQSTASWFSPAKASKGALAWVSKVLPACKLSVATAIQFLRY